MKKYFKLYKLFKYGPDFSISNAAYDLMTQHAPNAVKDSQINTKIFTEVKLHFSKMKKRHLCYFIQKNGNKVCSQCERKKKRKEAKDYCKKHNRYFF